MRTTVAFLFSFLLLSLTGCPAPAAPHDAAVTYTDMNVVPNDTNSDATSTGMDAGHVVTGTPITLANLVNPATSPTNGMAPNTRVTVQLTDTNLVALTPRLFISQSTTSMHCLFAIWVGTPAGGAHSGIEVTDSFLPTPGMDCFQTPPHVIPDPVNIGDSVTMLAGDFEDYCPSTGGACPTNTSQELSVSSGTFVVGGAGATPTATTVQISDITGTGTTLGPMCMNLQGAVVTIPNTVVVMDPEHSNHDVMMVAAMGTTTPTMAVDISKYSGVGAQRAILCNATAGQTVGSVTGVLQYSFGQWIIQVRQASDLPGLASGTDAGACPDA
jgi:hypothetical protein